MNSSQVNKNDSNYYIGISTGSTDHSSTNTVIEAAGLFTSSDTNPKGHKITLGKKISSVWAIELSYVDLGVMQRYHSFVVDITNTQRTDAVDFNIVVKKEINYLIDNIYIKAGPSYLHTRAHTIRIPEGGIHSG